MALIQSLLKIGVADQGFALCQRRPLELPMLVGQTDRRLGIGQFRQPINDALGIAMGHVIKFLDEAVEQAQIRRCQPRFFFRLSVQED